jgi:hypothetical protein
LRLNIRRFCVDHQHLEEEKEEELDAVVPPHETDHGTQGSASNLRIYQERE